MRLLFVTPVMPAATGNGLAMRAGALLEALVRTHEVDVVVVALWVAPDPISTVWTSRRAAEVVVVAPAHAAAHLATLPHEHVFVFRLYLAPFIDALLSRRVLLDLDDDDARTQRRIAEIMRDPAAARDCRRRARSFELLVRSFAPRVERLFTASALDARRLARRHGVRVDVLPNIVRAPEQTSPEGHGLLFLGTLSYAPNDDAARWLLDDIAPRTGLHVTVAGPGAAADLRGRTRGAVPDVAPLYAACRIVVAPLRAAGGTRIKILEAFAHRRPVVATRLAIEGLDVRADEHVLVADDAESFARACVRLHEDRALRERLVARGHALVLERHTPAALAAALAAARS